MPKIDLNQIHLFILRYRKILIALGFSFIVWSIAQNPPDGEIVLIANQFIPAHSKLAAEQFTQINISGLDTGNFISKYSEIDSTYSQNDIQPGSLIQKGNISQVAAPNNRVDVFISLDNQLEINAGTKLHLWSDSEEFKQLVSNDAVVRSSETDSYGTRLRVSVPISDEYSVMQSNDIKVVMVD